MTKHSKIESREFRVESRPITDEGEGWQHWPADDSDLAPMAFAPIRQHPHLRIVRVSIVASVHAGDRPASTEEVIVNAAIDRSGRGGHTAALQWFALAVAAAAVSAMFTAVSEDAQELASAEPTRGHIIEAPVGHRQPHEWQLPRQV